MASEAGVAQLVLLLASILVGLGVYGMTASRSLLRQMLGAEVAFNGVLLAALAILAPSGGTLATSLAILLIAIVAGEVIVTVAIIAGMYRFVRSLESSVMEEEGV